MEITFIDSTTETRISIYTVHKVVQGEDDIGWTPAFLMDTHVLILFSDDDKSASLQCTVMTEDECWISFNVVESETRTTAYNLQIYGGVTSKQTPLCKMEFPCKSLLVVSFPRLSRAT